MKKNISINISGIIFHIEEDGYDQLKSYLESINKYFSSYDDSLEIVADIESRIAEIFLAKLKEGQQVITLEDVEALMSTMGSIKDFQAAEEEATIFQEPEQKEPKKKAKPLFSQKLYRDNKRKLIAGVLAGIAYYFSIDPLWIRLIYIALFLGISVLPSWGGFLFIAYIVLWIIVPASDDLPEEKKVKKMFRDPDNKVLGGVASGIAAYFGIDVVIVRLLFFISIFFAGTGVILYLILWIILPEAKTLTDKMEMQGEPVTLSNIEQNIKKSLNMENGEENLFMKVLLFPFRVIAIVFEFLSHALGPFSVFLVEAFRIFGGILLIIIGVSGILVVIVAIGILIGLIAEGDFYMLFNIPFEVIRHDIQILPLIAASLFIIIPMLMVALLGFAAIMQKKVIRASFALPMLVLWIASLITITVASPKYIRAFKREGSFSVTRSYDLKNKTLVLHFHDIGPDRLDAVSLKLEGTDGDKVLIKQNFKALGPDRRKAAENAQQMIYLITAEDSVITFDSKMEFKPDARYRRQELSITVFIPNGEKFVLDPDMKYLLGGYMYRQGFSNRMIGDHVWMFKDFELVCLTCPDTETETGISEDTDDRAALNIKGPNRRIELSGFSEVVSSGPVRLVLNKSDHFEVVLQGDKKEIKKITLDRTDEVLTVKTKQSAVQSNRTREVTVYLRMPELQRMVLGGACRALIDGFDNDQIEVKLSGAASSEMNVNPETLIIDLRGASRLELNGAAENLRGVLSGASYLKSFYFEAGSADLKTMNAASAKIRVNHKLRVRAEGASEVLYRGNPRTEITKSKESTVRKD